MASLTRTDLAELRASCLDGKPISVGTDPETMLALIALAERALDAEEGKGICGMVCACGPHGESLACGWRHGHDGTHSWATLPTRVDGEPVS